MPPNAAAADDDDPSAFGAPAVEAGTRTDYDAEELEVMEAEEGSVARGLAQPSQPLQLEVAEHNLTLKPRLHQATTPAAAKAGAAGAPVSHLQVRRLNSLHVYLPGKKASTA